MKIFQSIAFLAAAAVASISARPALLDLDKRVFTVKIAHADLRSAVSKYGQDIDVWKEESVGDGLVEAEIYASKNVVAALRESHGDRMLLTDDELIDLWIKRLDATFACRDAFPDVLADIETVSKYTDAPFFNCFRIPEEVFGFMDKLVELNPTVMSKISQVATTIEGQIIPAYKISTGAGRKALYTQGLIHAREWQAGSTTYYAMASLLDGVRKGDAEITAILNEYDWYFVPILNIDGHFHSWTVSRFWRKNRRAVGTDEAGEPIFGVDLNRNYPPTEFFGKGLPEDGPATEVYPGTGVLSEPETSGTWKFMKSLPNLKGAIDMHTYGGLVLYPFGNQFPSTAPEPWGSKFAKLGVAVADATMRGNDQKYIPQTSAQLYAAYGTFPDGVFLDLNKTAAFTYEIESDVGGFIVPDDTIRPRAQGVFQGMLQFARELDEFYSGADGDDNCPDA